MAEKTQRKLKTPSKNEILLCIDMLKNQLH